MEISRSLNLRDQAYSSLVDAFSAVQIYGETSDQLNARVRKIRAHLQNRKAPSWTLAYIDGARQALTDALYRHNLEYASFVDDTYVSHQRRSPDYYENHGLTPRELHEKHERGGHYWRETHKPFFISSNA